MRKDLEVKKDGKTIKFYIQSPTSDVVSRADRYRAKIWTECLEDGIKTKEEPAFIANNILDNGAQEIKYRLKKLQESK